MDMPTLAIIIPCYNEELCIETTVKRLLEVLQMLFDENKIASDSYLYLVDDGSGDSTWEIIERLHSFNHKHVKAMKFVRNYGNQKALVAGLEGVNNIGCDCCISIDADLQQDENTIEDFIKELAELSKYGGAGYTGIEMEFYRSSYGNHPEIIHQSEDGRFRLLANPSGYSHQVVLYDSELGWDWYKEETKKYIAMNKDMILDVIEKKIAQSMTDYIGNSKAVDKNIKLKKEIDQLKN